MRASEPSLFRIKGIIYDDLVIRPRLYRTPTDSGEYTMSSQFTEFLLKHCTCVRCGNSIRQFDDHLFCETSDFVWADVEPVVPMSLAPQFKKAFQQEMARKKQFQRDLRLREAGGTHSAEQIADLLTVQEARCFYCFAALISEDGTRRFHRDHFVPLEHKGSNDISNIVLSCVSCNVEKGVRSPDAYIRWKLKKLPESTRIDVARIQEAVHSHKSSNPSIEGMPKRLRLLCTPHVKR
jgi:5-methylcytosine-specific restriction endonuclease McrA